MDDFIIIHQDKEYLKECLTIIKDKLRREYDLEINKKKTMIINAKNGFTFLGYHFKVINKKTIIKLTNESKRKIISGIKNNLKLYKENKITFKQVFSSIETYKHAYKFVPRYQIKNIMDRYL